MSATHAYIGRNPECGCVVAIVVDDPEYRKATAKDVSDFVKAGYAVERVSIEEGSRLIGHRCQRQKVSS